MKLVSPPTRNIRQLYGTNLYIAVPSFVIGVILGPVCANLIDARRWGGHVEEGQIAYVSDPT